MSIGEAKNWAAEHRKDVVLRELATCESGGHGDADRKIVGGGGVYHGRFQFLPQTVKAYVQLMDGRTLNLREATDLAHDYDQAAALAKFMIFERDRAGDWPLCARKIGLRQQVEEIRSSL